MPYIPASKAQVNNVFTLLRGQKGGLVDLGSGDGRIVCIIKIFRFLSCMYYMSNQYIWIQSCTHCMSNQDIWIPCLALMNNEFLTLVIIYSKGPGSLPAGFHPSCWL